MSIMRCEKHQRNWDSDKLDDCPECENEPLPMKVDDEARWNEIQKMSDAIANRDEPPTPVESALCGAVWRARQWKTELRSEGRETVSVPRELLQDLLYYFHAPLSEPTYHLRNRLITGLEMLSAPPAPNRDAEEWRLIETAPEEGVFQVYMPDEKKQPIQTAKWHPKIKVIGNHFMFDMPKPTHWRPLPPAPAALAAAPERDAEKWQPIETAPKDGTHVLVWDKPWTVGSEARFIDGDGWWLAGNHPTDHWGEQIYPTYWQPLPAAPAAPKQEDKA